VRHSLRHFARHAVPELQSPKLGEPGMGASRLPEWAGCYVSGHRAIHTTGVIPAKWGA